MQIKCTFCGATQELTVEHKCDYCKSVIKIKKAQKNYNNYINSEIGKLMLMAKTAVDTSNWEYALHIYNQILVKEITNSEAWLWKGIAILNSSKIGNDTTKEAIAYWKNAIIFSENLGPTKLRVVKEIIKVIKPFFNNLLNHYNKFSHLDDSYEALAERFLILESIVDFATHICPDEPEIYKIGYDLCELVIKAPEENVTSVQYAKTRLPFFKAIADYKHTTISQLNDWGKNYEKKKQIKKFSSKIKVIYIKYKEGLIRLNAKTKQHRTSKIDFKSNYEGFLKKLHIGFGI